MTTTTQEYGSELNAVSLWGKRATTPAAMRKPATGDKVQ